MDDGVTFPQRAADSVTIPNPMRETDQRTAGPNFFRDDEFVQFMRADSLVGHSFSDNVLRLTVRTIHLVNRTAQTHDTVMHQFLTEKDSFGQMSFELAFVTPEIFRVKFAGRSSTLEGLTDDPQFPPPGGRMLCGIPQIVDSTVEENCKGCITLKSTAVELKIQPKPFRLLAYRLGEKAPFWKQRLSDLFTSDVIPTSISSHKGREASFEAFVLDPQEEVFGLGERFDGVGRRGRPVDFVNHDAIGTSSPRTYINVPFFWSTKGYGCFLNSIARTEWDMGVSESGTVGFSTEEPYMDYFIISGETPASILQKYTRDLTGTAPSLPVWTYGIWFSRNSYHSWEVVDSIVKKAEDLKIPLDVIHLDTAWFQEDWSSDLIFGDRFPEPESHMASLKEAGVRISLWQYNFVPPKADNKSYVEGLEGDYFGKMVNPDGSRGKEVFRYPPNTTGWKKDDCVIDFSNPAARDWYSRKIENLITQGAAAIKTDFGDCIPSAAHYMNIAGRRFQNLYSLVYNMTIWNAIQSKDRGTIVWARSGTAGSQRYPVHWGGDSQCSWSGLQGSLRATLSIGLSGFPYFSHDMGGFIGKPTAELYVRWMQVSMFSSHVRSHGAGNENAREPWHFGDQAVQIYKKFAYLRYQLLPYIVEQAKAGAKLGLPLCRALILEYPQDRNVWGIETEFLFGNDLLIAPTLTPLEESDRQVVYIPSGTWYCFWTKRKLVSRGEWIELAAAPLDHLHIWVKSGAMICFSKERYHTYNTVGDLERVEIYGPAECQSKSCENGQGEKIEVVKGSNGTWSCLGRNTVAVKVFE